MKKGRKTPESKLLTNDRWNRQNTKQYGFRCMYKTDQDIIDKLDSLDNKNKYIKDLIRQDIQRNSQND